MAIHTIGDLVKELSDYPHDTRIDFVMLEIGRASCRERV